jgi:sugar lactone lactonase YvrE
MKKLQAELLLDARASLGEGPVWRESEQALYWVDIIQSKIHKTVGTSAEGTVQDHVWTAPMPIGCYTFTRSGRLLGAGAHGFGWLTLEGEEAAFEPWVDPEADKPNRFNDGKCDARGRFLAGSMASRANGETIPGAFYSLEPDGTWQTLLDPVGISNGIAFTPDSKTMYYIDTTPAHTSCPSRMIWKPERSPTVRSCEHSRETKGRPDGMTIDNEGNLWGRLLRRRQKVRCIRPSGRRDPGRNRCARAQHHQLCFGGPDYAPCLSRPRESAADEEF